MSASEEARWQPGSGPDPGVEYEDSVPAEHDDRVVDNKETHLAEEQNKRTEENDEQQNKVIEDLKQRLDEKMNNLLTFSNMTEKINSTAPPSDLVEQRLPSSKSEVSRGSLSGGSPLRRDLDEPRLREQKQEDAETDIDTDTDDADGSTVDVDERALLDESSETPTTLLDEPKSSKQKQTGTETKAKQIAWNVKPPPENGEILFKLINEDITSYLSFNGLELIEDDEGPAVVTVVNTSHGRAQGDIERAMEAADLTSSEAKQIILLRIKPTTDPHMTIKKIEKVNILDLVFFAQNNKKLHECPHNKEQILLLMEYFELPVPSILKDEIAKMKENMVKISQATNCDSEVVPEDTDDLTVVVNPTPGAQWIQCSGEPSSLLKQEDNLTKDEQITCNVKPPPPIGEHLHCQILEKIRSTVHGNGYELKTDGEGPTLVTVVNTGQAKNDISRGMAAANLRSLDMRNVILLRIKPTLNPSERVPKTQGCLLDLVFLCDQRNKNLHDCEHNDEQCHMFVDHFLSQTTRL